MRPVIKLAVLLHLGLALPTIAATQNEAYDTSLEAFAGWSHPAPEWQQAELCALPSLACTPQTTLFDLYDTGSFFALVANDEPGAVRLEFFDLNGLQYGEATTCAAGITASFDAAPKIESVPYDVSYSTLTAIMVCNDRKILIRARDTYKNTLDRYHFLDGDGINGDGGTWYGVVRKDLEIEF